MYIGYVLLCLYMYVILSCDAVNLYRNYNIKMFYLCDIWCVYSFGGIIDVYSALGVVY